ncbi:hypothetical protein D9M71_394790 [compost metagenome]
MPLPFRRPVSFSTIGTNGRATDRSSPLKRNEPLNGLFFGNGLSCACTISSPSLPPTKLSSVSMRLGVSLLVSFRVWYGKSSHWSLSLMRNVPPPASTLTWPLGPLAGRSSCRSALSRPCQAKSFGNHCARLSIGNCLR